MKLCMYQTVPLSIIRSLFTVHQPMVYVIQVCRQLLSRTCCLQTCMTYTIAEFTMNKLLMMGRGTVRNMLTFMPICEISAPIWFYYKEVCYDTRSHERKITAQSPINSLYTACLLSNRDKKFKSHHITHCNIH